jgi:shikimate kinase
LYIIKNRISYETLTLRVGDLALRGVVGEHADTLEGIYRERIPLYEKYADVTVSAEYANPADAARAVAEALEK